MIVFVRVETRAHYDAGDGDFKLKRRFEELSGEPCLVIHLSQASPALMADLRPRALLLSGCGTWFRDFDVREFWGLEDVVRTCVDVPTLAFCGSHQLLGFMFNHGMRNLTRVEDEPLRPLRPGEPDFSPGAHAGLFTEYGFHAVRKVEDDPLLADLPDPFIVREWHQCEIKTLPPEFVLLATNDNCRVQAMRHRSRLLYGTQFHPESYAEPYTHGRTVLRNFFRLAGLTVPEAPGGTPH
jgi:anthranilate/para-aminobenzoate synthase component II